MVEIADKQASSMVNRAPSETTRRNRIRSSFDDLFISPEELSKKRLANELASELWRRLPISRSAEQSGGRGIEKTIRIATSSASQVQAWYRELCDFVPAIAKAAIELRGEKLSDAMSLELSTDMERQMLQGVRYPLPSRSFVDFKFAALPPAEAWTQAQRRLEQECLQFANHVFALFDLLQQKSIIGQIQETSSTCRFTFFRRIAIAAPPKHKIEKRSRVDPIFQFPGHTIFLEESFQISDYGIQHRNCQCVHHVRNPVLNRPNETANPLPEKYRCLIDACPDWLADSVRVLEGELFREERIEWDLYTENRRDKDEKVIERVRRCPAVVFGPFILAGWGEATIKEEESRQRRKQTATTRKLFAKKARISDMLALVVGVLAVAVIALTGATTAATTSLAVLLGLAAMLLAGNAAHLRMIARESLSATKVLAHSTLIGATVFAVQGLLFGMMHWSLPAFGLAALASICAVGAFSVQNADATMGGARVG
ncbi:MAG TPA: hypothetical protein DDW52_05770 [Planctomycetaceae bacterium]|nr:hypothetical protein [Planctomycetaceae bacterium]